MATYYWVTPTGTTGTWDATTTTNWATSSGGAGSAGVPTSADNVVFDNLSYTGTYAVNVGTNAVAANITINAPNTGTVTITSGATAVITCYGSWLNAATGVAFSVTSGANITFAATATGKTVSTNGITLGATNVAFNGVGGGWTLSTTWLSTSSITLTNGSLNTNGQTVSCTILNSNNSNTRTLTLGSSTINLSNNLNLATTTGLTFSGASSTINITPASPTFSGGGLTYGTVNFTSASSCTSTITGANTFTNITQTSRSTTGLRTISLGADQTITGTLTLQTLGTPVAIQRTFVQSDTLGTRRNIYAANLAGMTDVDFRDINGSGAASWTGTRLGDCLNNSGITFPTGLVKYWNLAAGGNWSSNAWSLTYPAGAVSVDNFPLAQDTASIRDSGLNSGASITMDINWNLPSINFFRTLDATWACGTTNLSLYGFLALPFGGVFSVTGTSTATFFGQGVLKTITSNGYTFGALNITFNSVTGTISLYDALTTTGTTTLTSGTLTLNNNTLTTNIFSGSGSATRRINSGTGSFSITGNSTTVVSMGTTTNLTSDVPPLFLLTDSGSAGTRTVSVGISTNLSSAPDIYVTNGSDTFTTSGTSTVRNLVLTSGFTGTLGNATRNIYGNLTLHSGIATPSSGSLVTTFIGVGTHTIDSFGKPLDFPITFNGTGSWTLNQNMLVGPVASPSTRTLTINAGNIILNTYSITAGLIDASSSSTRSIAFGSSGKLVANGVGNINALLLNTSTGLTYTGTSRIEITGNPSAGTTRVISGPQASTGGSEANAMNLYITAGSDTVNLGTASRIYKTVDFTGFTGTWTSASNATIYGDLVLVSGMTYGATSTNGLIFASTSATPRTIATAGITFNCTITFNGVGGTWELQDALTIASTKALTLTNGTLKLKSGTTNTVGSFVTPGSNQIYLQATTLGVQATISAASGTNNATNITLRDSNATGGATWNAYNTFGTINAGNVTGWNFYIALTSASSTGTAGTVGTTRSPIALTGVQSTGQAGNVYTGWYTIPNDQSPVWTNITQS